MPMKKGIHVLCGLFAGAISVFSQTWTQTIAPTNYVWSGVASSADGTHLVAVVGGQTTTGPIYTSTNSGLTWISNNAPQLGWVAVCSSADGTKLAASVNGGRIWTNSGTTWNQAPTANDFYRSSSIACSANGSDLVALDGTIYISTNAGKMWSVGTGSGFQGCAMSADGKIMLAIPAVSTNSGATWFSPSFNNGGTEFRAAASSANGVKLVAMGDGGIWLSTNSGSIFNYVVGSPTSANGSVASSADGTRLILARHSSLTPIYISTNSGNSWTFANAPSNYWVAVASSADGNALVAAANTSVGFGGSIWTWQATPVPSLNLTPENGNVALSWLIPSANFVLQQSSDLADWSDVTNAPVLNFVNLQNQVSLSPSNSIGFYRLATP
jgi:hypothetical protein